MDTDPIVGTQVAGYSIESVLGRGGMGVVYLARQHSPDRRVALKLINPAFVGDDAFRRRFLRESVAAAAIDHPHILPVYDAGESEGVLFMAMRLVDGQDLREILRVSERLETERVLAIIGQVGGALDAAHGRGLVHRDVKPGNILVAHQPEADDTDFCYLTDFGVSVWTTSSAATMTTAGHMVGSANYAAPEQIEGRRVDARADVYSLGCVLYECLTGSVPFAGRSGPGILFAHLHEEPPRPSSLWPVLPPAVDDVVGRALEKQPDDRFASCRDLTLELRAALVGAASAPATEAPATGAAAEPPFSTSGRRGRGGRRLWIGATAVAAALVIGLTGRALVDRMGHAGTSPTSAPPGSTHPSPPERIRAGVQVTASHTAPSATDAAGNPVSYLPGNVIDGNVQTAWRVAGNGVGETVTLIFDRPVDIVRIGLIPGYAKFDPETGDNRFEQDRIIKEVQYLIPGLPPTVQRFRPQPFPQFVRVSATTSRITVEILGTTAPGGLDYTAISEIYVYGYPQ
jgi:serine/threonine-protein kinase